jgi:hypothetical protein
MSFRNNPHPSGTDRTAHDCCHPDDEQDPGIFLYHFLSPLPGFSE